jgi:hypothetical protein
LPIEKRIENKNFEFGHNLKWYIIRISFERVLRNILNLINLQNKVNKFTAVINLRGVSTNNSIMFYLPAFKPTKNSLTHSNSLHLQSKSF